MKTKLVFANFRRHRKRRIAISLVVLTKFYPADEIYLVNEGSLAKFVYPNLGLPKVSIVTVTMRISEASGTPERSNHPTAIITYPVRFPIGFASTLTFQPFSLLLGPEF